MFRLFIALVLSVLAVVVMAEPVVVPPLVQPVTPPAAAVSPEAAPAAEGEVALDDEAEEPQQHIYLVARIKLTGTDLTQVAFLRHPAISTMEACETERIAGLMAAGWQHLSKGFLQSLQTFAYTADYRCVQTLLPIARWRYGTNAGYFYRVTTTDSQLVVKEFDNFFACRRSLDKAESIDAFCARSSQAVILRKE
jgi:hypothetical protein